MAPLIKFMKLSNLKLDAFLEKLPAPFVRIRQDNCGKIGGGLNDSCAPVVAYSDAPPVVEPSNHDFDLLAAFVSELVIFCCFCARRFDRDATVSNVVRRGIAESVGVTAAAAQQPNHFAQAIQKICAPGIIANLTRRLAQALEKRAK